MKFVGFIIEVLCI